MGGLAARQIRGGDWFPVRPAFLPVPWFRSVPVFVPRRRGCCGHVGRLCPACGASGGLGGGKEGVRGDLRGEPWGCGECCPLRFPRSGDKCSEGAVDLDLDLCRVRPSIPRWPVVLPVPRFRWLVCGSSLA